jgi:hypothetical protein
VAANIAETERNHELMIIPPTKKPTITKIYNNPLVSCDLTRKLPPIKARAIIA